MKITVETVVKVELDKVWDAWKAGDKSNKLLGD